MTIVIRTVVLVAGIAGYTALLPVLYPDTDGGANIGAGLIAFGLLVVACGGWGLYDGLRRPIGSVLRVWLVVGLLVGAAWPFLIGLFDGGLDVDLDVVFADLLFLAPFTMGLVCVPALVGAAIGSTVAQARTPRD